MIESIKNYLKKFLPPLENNFNNELQKLESEVTKLTPKTIINFGVPLVEHCNLKCCGCDHFAPIAEHSFANIGVFQNDFARLSELFNGEAVKIGLLGGEPLLHPQVKDFLYIARKYFPKTRIRIVSNGVLLLKQKDDFWESCRQNNIIIEITKYPINLKFDEMQKIASIFGVTMEFRDDTSEVQKTSYHIPLDVKGRQDASSNFMKCFHANFTIFLKNGKFYTCTVAPNIGHFNKYFNMDLPISDRDSIDIYKAQSAQEIFEFLSKPIPFCKFCYVEKRSFGHPWQRSKKDIKEWTV